MINKVNLFCKYRANYGNKKNPIKNYNYSCFDPDEETILTYFIEGFAKKYTISVLTSI